MANATPPPDLVLLSGGLDSATLLAELARAGVRPSGLFVDYGQPVADLEREASRSLAVHFGSPWRELVVTGLGMGSVSMSRDGEVPGRNALLAVLALVAGQGAGPACIHLGIHAGTPYRDCSPEFISAVQAVLDFHARGQVRLVAPFLHWRKETIFARALELDLPIDLTHSCERGSRCRDCRSCADREALLAHAA